MLLLPFFATVLSAWMNMSVERYPAIIGVSSLALAPGWKASSESFSFCWPGVFAVNGTNGVLAELPSIAFTNGRSTAN